MMANRNRLIVLGLAGALILSGFGLGRVTSSIGSAEALKAGNKTASAELAPSPGPEAAAETQSFYLNDFKSGYSDGYSSGLTGQGSTITTTTRPGYNEGFKEGFADGYQIRADGQEVATSRRPGRIVYRTRSGGRTTFVERKRGSKLKTILTIAGPAALGAGIGLAAAGKRGAGAGALIGGGGGALYHLFRNRR